MSIANRYNHAAVSRYNYEFPEPGTAHYVTLKEMYSEQAPERIFGVYALFINDKGNYGPQPIACSDGRLIFNLPAHLLEDVKKMREDPEVTEAINDGKLGFKIRTYQRKGSRSVLYTVEWVDM